MDYWYEPRFAVSPRSELPPRSSTLPWLPDCLSRKSLLKLAANITVNISVNTSRAPNLAVDVNVEAEDVTANVFSTEQREVVHSATPSRRPRHRMIKIFSVRLRVLFMCAIMGLAWGDVMLRPGTIIPHSTHVSDIKTSLHCAFESSSCLLQGM